MQAGPREGARSWAMQHWSEEAAGQSSKRTVSQQFSVLGESVGGHRCVHEKSFVLPPGTSVLGGQGE